MKPEKGSNPRVHRGILAGTARRRKTAYHNILILFLVIQQSTHWNPRRPLLRPHSFIACRPAPCHRLPTQSEDAMGSEERRDYTRLTDGYQQDHAEYRISSGPGETQGRNMPWPSKQLRETAGNDLLLYKQLWKPQPQLFHHHHSFQFSLSPLFSRTACLPRSCAEKFAFFGQSKRLTTLYWRSQNL